MRAALVWVRCVPCAKTFHRTYKDEAGYGPCSHCGGVLQRQRPQAAAQDRKAKEDLAWFEGGDAQR